MTCPQDSKSMSIFLQAPVRKLYLMDALLRYASDLTVIRLSSPLARLAPVAVQSDSAGNLHNCLIHLQDTACIDDRLFITYLAARR